VVERPVQEQVNLREERVHVERRAVDRPLSEADAAFRDRTIEAEERREEAVVSKEARVKEELVVRKDVEQRTETISDTVRSTEVDVEDERSSNATDRSGTTDRR
jgi:stress response protein YsnF